MPFTAEPITGEWYHDNELDFNFVIISIDEYEGLITIHRENAEENEEITLDAWDEMLLEPADSPLRDKGIENNFLQDDDSDDDQDLDKDLIFDEE